MSKLVRYRIDDVTIDFSRRKIFRNKNKAIPLSALSFETLQALVEAAPEPLTADQLIERAWKGAVVSDETVTQRIRLLRQALGDDTSQPRYIETIRSSGYRVIPLVLPVADRAAFRVQPWVAGLFLVLVATGIGTWFTNSREVEPAATTLVPAIPTGTVTASELADSARSLLKQRSPESLAHAITLYEQALGLEPDNAQIRASLALALSFSVAWYGDRIELAQRAEQLAREALAESVSFNAEMALGLSLDAQGKMDPAQAAYERAVALDPNHYGARASLAYLLQEKGRLVEALSHNMAALEFAPPGHLDVQVAGCLRLLGFNAVASEWLERADRLDPDSAHAAPSRALDLLARGEFDQAEFVIDQAIGRGIQQVELFEYKALLAMRDGDLASARAVIQSAPESISHRRTFEIWRQIIDASTGGRYFGAASLRDTMLTDIAGGDTWPGNFLYVAMLDVVSGRKEDALDALRNLQAAGYRDYLWLEFLPPLQPLRSDSEFQNIVESMRDDVEYQREQVLTATWLPDELRDSEGDQINSL